MPCVDEHSEGKEGMILIMEKQKKTLKISLKTVILIFLLILAILTGCGTVIWKYFSKNNYQVTLNNEFACIGEKDGYLYLINNELENEKIYKISNYYNSEYIVRDGRVYIIYDEIGGNTKYVDVIDLTNNTQQKITIDEIENDKLNLKYNLI